MKSIFLPLILGLPIGTISSCLKKFLDFDELKVLNEGGVVVEHGKFKHEGYMEYPKKH